MSQNINRYLVDYWCITLTRTNSYFYT